MPRSFTDEAIVLKAHNVGETDRFLVLLTRRHGRMTARVAGARRLQSRRGRGLLPLHKISCTWEEHSFGCSVTAAECLSAHDHVWRDPHAFSAASQGIELVLKVTEDGYPLPEIFALTDDFLSACDAGRPTSVSLLYTLKLLDQLGYLPSASTAPAHLSRELFRVIDDVRTMPFASAPTLAHLEDELAAFVSSLLGSQLGVTLKSLPVSLALSSAVTPTCHVSGRAS